MLLPTHYNPLEGVSSFTGADIKAVVSIHGVLKILGELQTISYSTHREKTSVMLMGRVNPMSFTRGPRTIAGSMIFTVFNTEVLRELMESHPEDPLDGGFGSLLSDQIPPFNITISFINEDGHQSSLVIYGVDIVDEGQNMSINDMIIENVKSYKARGIDLMWKTPEGVWTNTSTTAPKVSSKAIFTANPTLGLSVGTDTLQQYQRVLQDIENVQREIDLLDEEHAALTTGSVSIYGTSVQNLIDTNRLSRDKKVAELYNLERTAAQYKVLLRYSTDPRDISHQYLQRR